MEKRYDVGNIAFITPNELTMRNLFSEFPTRSNTNWAVQSQKMARGLKLWMPCTIYVAKTKGADC